MKKAFTLIELIIVIAIIALLAALTLTSLSSIRAKTYEVTTRNDIQQLSNAMVGFQTTYNCPPVPTFINMSTPSQQDMVWLKRVWPRLTPNTAQWNTSTVGKLDGNQAMVFFLGGYANGVNLIGFYSSQSNPFVGGAAGRESPFFSFPPQRVVNGKFIDPYGTPYVYMSCLRDNDYNAYSIPSGSVQPYMTDSMTYCNRSSFQIISAGANKSFGPGGVWSPGVGWYGDNQSGADDISNFHPKLMGIR